MKRHAFCSRVLFSCILLSAIAVQSPAQSGARGIAGDWRIEGQYEGQTIVSILTLSAGKEGKLGGEWISYWGVGQLKDIKQEGTALSFVQTARFGDSDFTANFAGTVAGGKLEGTLTSDQGELKVQGRRMRAAPQAAGTWDMAVKAGEREYTGKLVITAAADGKLQGAWQSDAGDHTISDVAFSKGKLTFKRASKMQDRQWESAFEGTIKAHVLTGAFKSDRGDAAAEGKRVGAGAVGKWDLQITSESGSRSQVLKVNPDLSALFGPIALDRIALDGDQIAFKTVVTFGDQTYDIAFSGKVEGAKLTGELTSSWGTRKVEGVKRQAVPAKKAQAAQKAARAPDVIFVPTPQPVVDKMLELAKVTRDDVVYDLGCGDGRIVVTAAQKYGCKGVGYDINPQRVSESLANVAKENVGNLVRIEQEDIFTLDLSGANVVTLYLLPDLNVKLIPQLEKLKPGSRIVSHDFDMRGVEPDQVVRIEDDGDTYGDHTIYLWTTPLKRTGAVAQE